MRDHERATHEVVAVYSADRICIAAVAADGSYGASSEVVLADIVAASVTSQHFGDAMQHHSTDAIDAAAGEGDEYYAETAPGAMEARDYLRRHYLGRRVLVERGRSAKFVHLWLPGSKASRCASWQLVNQGLATIREESVRHDAEWRDELQQAETEAVIQRRGRHALRPRFEMVSRVRKFPLTSAEWRSISDAHTRGQTERPGVLPADAVERREDVASSLIGLTVACAIEEVFDTLTLRLVIVSSLQEVFFRFAGVMTSPVSPELCGLHRDAAHAIRRKILHRQHAIALEAFDANSGVFHGSFAQVAEPLELAVASGMLPLDPCTLPFAHRAGALIRRQQAAQRDGRGIWSPSLMLPPRIARLKPFEGIVVAVPCPTCVVVAEVATGALRSVQLAFVSCDEPKVAKTYHFGRVMSYSHRYLDARELLRSVALQCRVFVEPFVVDLRPDADCDVIAHVFAVNADAIQAPATAEPPGADDELIASVGHLITIPLAHRKLVDVVPLPVPSMALALQPPLDLQHAALSDIAFAFGDVSTATIDAAPTAAIRFAAAAPASILNIANVAEKPSDDENDEDGDIISPSALGGDGGTAAELADPFACVRETFAISHSDALMFRSPSASHLSAPVGSDAQFKAVTPPSSADRNQRSRRGSQDTAFTNGLDGRMSRVSTRTRLVTGNRHRTHFSTRRTASQAVRWAMAKAYPRPSKQKTNLHTQRPSKCFH
jgi:hypothetical protein